MSFKIAIVGEAYGEQEDYAKRAFVGPAGQELDRILHDAGLERGQCFVTNTFNLRPPRNDILTLCCDKKSGLGMAGRPPLASGKYIKNEYLSEIERLYSELREVRPNLTVLLGNTACWALLGQTAVSKLRGAVAYSPYIPGLKVLPTYHPAAVLRQYELRAVTVMDFVKAKVECEYPEIRRKAREVWLDPDLNDIETFYRDYILPSSYLSFDIETAGTEITCIGFAPSETHALVIPFRGQRKQSSCYWETPEQESQAWDWVRRILATPSKKVAQNGIYDISHLWFTFGIPVTNFVCDTMIRHHSLFPELPKGLDFLGSVYANEPAWKMDRPRKGADTIKRDE